MKRKKKAPFLWVHMTDEDPITKDWITKEFDNNHMQAGIEWALNISPKYYIYHS